MPYLVTKLRIQKVDGVDRGAAVGARVTLRKRAPEASTSASGPHTNTPAEEPAQPPTEVAKETPMPTLADVLAGLDEQSRKVIEDALAAKAGGSEGEAKASDMSDEELEKQAPAVAKRLQEQRDAIAKADAEKVALAKRLADMEDQLLTKEIVAKAHALQGGAVGLDAPTFTAILKSAAKGEALTKAHTEALDAHFRAVDEMRQQLSREVGKVGKALTTSAEKAQALAKAYRESHPEATDALAMAKVYEQHPDLYTALRLEEAAR